MENSNTKRPFATQALLYVAGEGGHLAQARRLSAHIDADIKDHAVSILLTDHDRTHDDAFDYVYSLPTCAPKHRKVRLSDIAKYWLALVKAVYKLKKNYKVKSVIVTGPGFALFPALAFKVMGATLIVFESWSRFEDKSKCGKALYPFAKIFLVQHKSMLKIYPKALWVGLL